jgi:hypothetical protein
MADLPFESESRTPLPEILKIRNVTFNQSEFHKKGIGLIKNQQLFQPQYHCRDLSSRNAHLVHENWYRISFTFLPIGRRLG